MLDARESDCANDVLGLSLTIRDNVLLLPLVCSCHFSQNRHGDDVGLAKRARLVVGRNLHLLVIREG